jgi:hypothetical protein
MSIGVEFVRARSGLGQKRRFGDVCVTSALPLNADIHRKGRHVSNVPNVDINCRDRVVRSLAGPEPDREVFAKFKHLSRKAAAHS